jgi:hypothetical protein
MLCFYTGMVNQITGQAEHWTRRTGWVVWAGIVGFRHLSALYVRIIGRLGMANGWCLVWCISLGLVGSGRES